MNIAIVCAAGSGKRLEKKLPKALVSVAGKPMFLYSVEAFGKARPINSILLIIPKGYQREFERAIKKHLSASVQKKIIGMIFGGAERQDSIRHGIEFLNQIGTSSKAAVLVHNAANIFLTVRDIEGVLDHVWADRASAVVLPSPDTLRELSNNMRPKKQLDRHMIWRMQTPQGASLAALTKAHRKAHQDSYYGTDEIELLERIKYPTAMIAGDKLNFKITYPEDLAIAEAIVKCRKRQVRN